METTTIKAIKDYNLKLQESLDSFKNIIQIKVLTYMKSNMVKKMNIALMILLIQYKESLAIYRF